MTDSLLAYISRGQLHLERDGVAEILESAFGRSLRDRAVQIYNRNAWKMQGRGGQSLTRALRMPAEREPGGLRVAITSVTRGINPGELLYTLETDEISGAFLRDSEGVERRLFHTADYHVRHLDVHPGGTEVAVSVHFPNQAANLAIMKMDGSGLTEVTDGESVDQAPCWVPGPGRRLVFQSAGIAFDSLGRYSGIGPSTIQQLDLDTSQIACLVQDPNFDLLWPRIRADGTLYYIRRPNAAATQPAVNPWANMQRTALAPFRFLYAIVKIIEMIAEYRAGQPLFTPKSPDEKAVKTPSSWLLMRQSPDRAINAETLAEGVGSFDLAADGSVIYSNGFDVNRIPAEGGRTEKILADANIDFVAAL